MKNLLLAADMLGTVNALDGALALLTSDERSDDNRWFVTYAAGDVALDKLKSCGLEPLTPEADFAGEIDAHKPDLVVVGAQAGKTPSGIEVGFGFAAMNVGIPVVCYRDFSGLNDAVAGELAMHGYADELLTFAMFDKATVGTVRERNYACRDAVAIGSGYYDADATCDWETLREQSRNALGLNKDDFFVLLNCGSSSGDGARVLEYLKPVTDGLRGSELPVCFTASFHPKDKAACLAKEEDGAWKRTGESPYFPLFGEWGPGKNVSVFDELELRSVLSDGKARIAAADFVIANPLSTDTWTCVYGRTPFLTFDLPLTSAMAKESGIEIGELDFVMKGACDFAESAEALESYMESLSSDYEEIAERLRVAQSEFRAEPASLKIAEFFEKMAPDAIAF